MQVLYSTLVVDTKLLLGVMITGTPSNNFVFISINYWAYIHAKRLTFKLMHFYCIKMQYRYSMRLLTCAGAEKQCPPMVPTGKALTCCNSLPACEKSFLTRKEYALCRSPHQLRHIHLVSKKGFKCNTVSDRNKTET